MSQETSTLWLSLFIIFGLPVIFGLAGWLFIKFWRDPKTGHSHACPHCQRQGQISLFGAFRCVSCGQVFYVNERGQDVPSLFQAFWGTLVWGAVSGFVIIGIDIHLAHPWWDSGCYWFHIMLVISSGAIRKKFPVEPV